MRKLFCLVQVDQSTVAIKESFGKFEDVLDPGCHCVPWLFRKQLDAHLNLRVQQLDVKCETKTKDNVFVNVVASIQYRALADKASDACVLPQFEGDSVISSSSSSSSSSQLHQEGRGPERLLHGILSLLAKSSMNSEYTHSRRQRLVWCLYRRLSELLIVSLQSKFHRPQSTYCWLL